jgi:hypothetical protein
MYSLLLLTCLLQLVFPPVVMASVLGWGPLLLQLSLVLLSCLLFMYSYCCCFFLGILSLTRVFAVIAFPSVVEAPSATDVSNSPLLVTCRDESIPPCRRVSDTSRRRCGRPLLFWLVHLGFHSGFPP